MNEYLNPKSMHQPGGVYSHTVHVPANSEWLVIAGQIGIDAEGSLANGIRAQSDQVFRNILAALAAHRMSKEDLVKTNVYLTDSRFIGEYRAARNAILGEECAPASTLVIVDGLASPDMLVEVEAWAARSPA